MTGVFHWNADKHGADDEKDNHQYYRIVEMRERNWNRECKNIKENNEIENAKMYMANFRDADDWERPDKGH